jgi:hypothetical protein
MIGHAQWARRASRIVGRVDAARRACASAYRRGGFAELGRLLSDAAYWRFHPRVRRWAAEIPIQQRIDEAFDHQFGVDTAGGVALSDIGLGAADVERGHGHYRPVWTRVLREALERIPGDLGQFTFVDYGSGKGKALLLASDYPFQEILGVEFARPLHEVAARNIERYSSKTQKCHRLRSECNDALEFSPPERPLVCFFFNPFDDATMSGVLSRLDESARRCPRDIYLVYANMRDVDEHERVFRAKACLSLLVRHPQYLIFRLSASQVLASPGGR